jgi:hypothetical protein
VRTPALLTPTSTEHVLLPSGREMALPKTTPWFPSGRRVPVEYLWWQADTRLPRRTVVRGVCHTSPPGGRRMERSMGEQRPPKTIS